MVSPDRIANMLGERIGRILDAAELGLDQQKFEVFRRIVLNEMGEKGLRRDLKALFDGSPGTTDRNGNGRNDNAGKEVPHD